jgi:hypothetical protein
LGGIRHEMWIDAVRRNFDGRIVMGRDLLVI